MVKKPGLEDGSLDFALDFLPVNGTEDPTHSNNGNRFPLDGSTILRSAYVFRDNVHCLFQLLSRL